MDDNEATTTSQDSTADEKRNTGVSYFNAKQQRELEDRRSALGKR